MPDAITVSKRDHNGQTKLEYTGEIIDRGETWVYLRAPFNFERVDMGFVVFVRGDMFTEWFYTDRWYNIFQINSREDGMLKGWYCNITRPAVLTHNTVGADDLALDLWVAPDGEVRLLDEDEFAALTLAPDEQTSALNAVTHLRQMIHQQTPPFDQINGKSATQENE
ncbi:MAG: DUF402 domain-containing protein [Anaerolineae bacterium]|nr:DUF402 domain-containing protein [Anaerolineae bacterium]